MGPPRLPTSELVLQVLGLRLKASSNRSGERSVTGRLFHVSGPLTAKLRWPVNVFYIASTI